jgi:hypothetical protein
MADTVFLRLLADDDKEAALSNAVASLHNSSSLNAAIYTANPDSFRQVPGSPFAYWVSDRIRQLFTKLPPFESEERTVKQGLATADDFRFVRIWWEVSPKKIVTGTTETTPEEFRQQTFKGKRWVPFAKGGEYSPYYADLHLVVNWERDGEEIKARINPDSGRPYSNVWQLTGTERDYFFYPGLTYPRRTQRGLSIRVHSAGCIFADKGPAIFTEYDLPASLLGLTNSIAFQGLVTLQMAFGSYEVGVIQRTPIPPLSQQKGIQVGQFALSCINLKRDLDCASETSYVFYLPALLQSSVDTLAKSLKTWQKKITKTERKLASYQPRIHDIAFQLYSIEGKERQAIETVVSCQSLVDIGKNSEAETDGELIIDNGQIDNRQLTANLISYTVGCIFGRWDIRFATGEKQAPELPDPFAPLPVYSLGMLVETIDEYPLQISQDGILVDNPNYPDDIISRVRDVLEVIWGDRAEAIEQETCEILGVKDLRDYFRKPSNGGFWTDHIKRYSKSRRKAPIYWLLQSSKKNYAIWIYYHRLDKDILSFTQ